MMSYFQKLGEQVEEGLRPELISFYTLYIQNNSEINQDVKNHAINISRFDKPDIFKEIPSQEVREGIVYATSICFEDKRVPTLGEAKDLLKRLK